MTCDKRTVAKNSISWRSVLVIQLPNNAGCRSDLAIMSASWKDDTGLYQSPEEVEQEYIFDLHVTSVPLIVVILHVNAVVIRAWQASTMYDCEHAFHQLSIFVVPDEVVA